MTWGDQSHLPRGVAFLICSDDGLSHRWSVQLSDGLNHHWSAQLSDSLNHHWSVQLSDGLNHHWSAQLSDSLNHHWSAQFSDAAIFLEIRVSDTENEMYMYDFTCL